MTFSRRRLLIVAAMAVVLLVLWCGAKVALRLPSREGLSASTAAPDTSTTRLGKAIVPRVADHPGTSGLFPLRDGQEAFAARVLLADAAERTLDVQYYIWHNDTSGSVLMSALRRAADRGVRVRLLLDDNNTSGLDAVLSALDAHPQIEVRLFNPFISRRWRVLGYLTDFPRLNRRMHNKSFTADNQAAIVGGRNVGDEYFGADRETEFVDLDVLAIGPVVQDVSRDFDRYWASESAYPLQRLVAPPEPASNDKLAPGRAGVIDPAAAVAYSKTIEQLPFVQEMLEGRLAFEWAPTQMVSDDPQKGLGRAPKEELLWTRLKLILGTPHTEIRLISPYFVPTSARTEVFVDYAKKGVKTTVLTNSLEATDVLAVHAGYAKRRKRLLEAGVTLYELKRSFSLPPANNTGMTGRSNSSLHAKTFAVDGARVFVGSFNFDPRSNQLNTELGFVIDSPKLAETMAEVFVTRIPQRAYRVRNGPLGTLQWSEIVDGREKIYLKEPHSPWWRRTLVVVLSWLPIEGLL